MNRYRLEGVKEFSPFLMLIVSWVFIAIGGLNKAIDLGIGDDILALGCGVSMIVAMIFMFLFWMLEL